MKKNFKKSNRLPTYGVAQVREIFIFNKFLLFNFFISFP